jgi:hypothetical protein
MDPERGRSQFSNLPPGPDGPAGRAPIDVTRPAVGGPVGGEDGGGFGAGSDRERLDWWATENKMVRDRSRHGRLRDVFSAAGPR